MAALDLKVALIITAAGSSTRHPPNKLLLELDGQSVIHRTIQNFSAFPGPVYVVTGYMTEEMERELASIHSSRVTIVHNPDYKNGLGTSVKCGVEKAGNAVDYWCFCPGDKPFIDPQTIRMAVKVLSELRPGILVSRYGDTPGHPSFFANKFWPDILSLEGDKGGRQLIARYAPEVHFLDVHDEGVIHDMDFFLERLNEHT